MTPATPQAPQSEVIQTTQQWLDRAVIGLNLCPFAKAVVVHDRLRYVVSAATDPSALLQDLIDELQFLAKADPDKIETTLLIHPGVLQDFFDFNDFLGIAEETVDDLSLDGVLQVASFHPQYQFAGTEPGDVENNSNRSPYPTLHLLRESSIDRAVASMPNPDSIYEANIETLQRLGPAGWAALWTAKPGA